MWYVFCFVLGFTIGVVVLSLVSKVMLKKKLASMEKMFFSEVNKND